MTDNAQNPADEPRVTLPEDSLEVDKESTASPFVGRDDVLARMHQHLTEPDPTRALLLLGAPQVGKSALLRRFFQIADAGNFCIYIPLREYTFEDEATWLKTLFVAAEDVARDVGFGEERLPKISDMHTSGATDDDDGHDPTEDPDALKAWLLETGFPKIFRMLSTYKRVVYLLDDIDMLARAIEGGKLPEDHPAALQRLISEQTGFIVTLSTTEEDDLPQLAPLVDTSVSMRLRYLSPDAVKALIQSTAVYTVPDTIAESVHRASGGHPVIVQHFATQLSNSASAVSKPAQPITEKLVKQVTPAVFAEVQPVFAAMWERLNVNERLVMSAIAGLYYADPLRAVTPTHLEKWLVETDYPLDIIAINVTLRALEYEGIIENRDNAVRLTIGLMQSWILDHGETRATGKSRFGAGAGTAGADGRGQSGVMRIMVLVISILVILAAVILLALSPDDNATNATTPEPTVTLSQGN